MRAKSTLLKRRNRFGWIFVLPWLIGFLRFFLYPLIRSVVLSFQQVNFDQGSSGGFSTVFVRFKNYIDAVTVDEKFITYVARTFSDLVINVPVILVFSFFVAVLLKQRFRGNSVAKAIFFLPVVLGTGIFLQVQTMSADTSVAEEEIKNLSMLSSFNIVNLLTEIGLPERITEYISGPIDRIFSVIMLSGIQIFIFLAGLNSVSPSLYEAADVEGASPWEAFWKITLPMVSPMIIVNVVYSIIDTFTVSTNVTMNYIDTVAFSSFNYGLSSAMSWIYCSVLTLILAVVLLLLSKRIVYES